MTPEVQQAVKELKGAFSEESVEATPDGQGGAYVVVNDVPVGERLSPSVVWFGFYLTFQYPNGDIYPHFVSASLEQASGAAIAREGVSGPLVWRSRLALQLSRKSNRWNPATDTALMKLLKVIEWVKLK